MEKDNVLSLLQKLCSMKSYVDLTANPPVTEEVCARFIGEFLKKYSWLNVEIECVAEGRYNVFASDCADDEIELLIVGHIDTVCESQNWSIPQGSIKDGRYYDLGAGDAKSGIAAMLDAIGRSQPTKGVAYLFYCDEEYDFIGFQHFLKTHVKVAPPLALSLCGASGAILASGRGLLEFEIVVRGHSGHAARQYTGTNAIKALMHVICGLEQHCLSEIMPYKTAFNLAAIHGGAFVRSEQEKAHKYPQVNMPANKIPDVAWALVDIRPGRPELNIDAIRTVADRLLAEFNIMNLAEVGSKVPAIIESFRVNHGWGAYHTTPEQVSPIVEAFMDFHNGKSASVETNGYIDAAELAVQRGSALVWMAPGKGNEHSLDEWVDIASLKKYRDGCVKLLARYTLCA